MAISLTDGGLLYPQIEPTYDKKVNDVRFYSASIPIGVVCAVRIPQHRKGTIVEFSGTCFIFRKSSVEMNGYSLMSGYSFPMYSTYSGGTDESEPVLVLRLK